MEGNNLIKKALVVAVILLFIGVAFAPSINANVSKASIESEMVEITTEVCGLNGGKHTVQLTKAEAEEVENLIDDIERRLDEVETREETVEIFNDVIIELDKYGLLGGLSVKQAQRLVTGRNIKFVENKIFRQLLENNLAFDKKYNFLCLTAGSSILSEFYRFPIGLAYYFCKLFGLDFFEIANIIIEGLSIGGLFLFFIYFYIRDFMPWNIMNTFFSNKYCNIFTIGFNGIQRWKDEYVIGTGFNGIKIITPTILDGVPVFKHWFIGFSLLVHTE